MRQIEDRWRINYRDAPNQFEEYLKMISNFQFNPSQIRDIISYKDFVFKKYLSNKCSNSCLNVKDLGYNQCFQNCVRKTVKSQVLLTGVMNKINI